MAKLKENTEINESIIESLGEDVGKTTNEVVATVSTDISLDNSDDIEVIKGEKIYDEIKDIPDYADKILKIYSDKKELFIGPFGEVHESSCNIKDVKENYALYKNPYHNKK